MKFKQNTLDKQLVNIGLLADDVARDDAENHANVNFPIDPEDEQAYSDFMQSITHHVAAGYDVTDALKACIAHRAKSLDFYGKVMSFFFLSFIMTYYVAIKNVILSSDPEHQIELDLFTYILPFVSFIIDAAVKRAYHMQVKSCVIFMKIIWIFFYLSFYVIAL